MSLSSSPFRNAILSDEHRNWIHLHLPIQFELSCILQQAKMFLPSQGLPFVNSLELLNVTSKAFFKEMHENFVNQFMWHENSGLQLFQMRVEIWWRIQAWNMSKVLLLTGQFYSLLCKFSIANFNADWWLTYCIFPGNAQSVPAENWCIGDW